MAKIDLTQTSFAAGEFGPSLFGRTDIAQYANACQIVENFLPRSYGPAISMPGTKFIREVSTSTLKTRLISFVFNRTDAYIIEMGALYFHFYTDGGIVITTGTTPFHLTHVYTESEIFDVQFTQLNDVVYLAHPDHPPQQLTRTAAASWAIIDFPFTGGPFLDANTDTSATLSMSATTGTINVTASTATFTVSDGTTKGHVDSFWAIGGLSQTNSTTGLDEEGFVKVTDVISTLAVTATVIKNIKAITATDDWAEGAWNAVRGFPARVVFHERRLFWARTAKEPQKVWGSRVFEYEDYALDTEADDDALNLSLASNESNEIQWLASGKSLIAGTYGGAFIINSGGSNIDVITPSNANATEEVGFGAENIAPKRIGHFLYYVQRFGRKLRELFYFWDQDTYKAVDRTILAPHVLGDGIVDMAVTQNPENILYCVKTDGTLATLTREADQEVTAWARHTTTGTYVSVAVIPSQSNLYDEAWVIVQRWINDTEKRFVEQFQDIEVPARQDLACYLHSALTYNGYKDSSAGTLTISLSATGGTGATITITASGNVFVEGDVNQRIRTIDALGATIGEGEITSFTSATTVNIEVSKVFDSLTYAVERWAVSVNSISGFDHLETEEVNVLADGGTDKPSKTVASGVITLADDYFVVTAGLSYDQIIQTLPKEAGSERGTSQGKRQKINEVSFKLNRSHRGFKVGGSSGTLDVAATRDPSTPMGTPELLFTGTLPNVSLQSDYEYGSTVYIKNEDPLPVELLNIIMNLETMDK